MLPVAVEQMPQIEEILAKKAENRAVTPEEYTLLGQFVDRVERRTIQIKEEAARVEDERLAAARAEIPAAAFEMPLDQAGIKEHIFNILTEANYETVGQLMLDMKTDPNKVLGLAGVGPKAIQNIEESIAALSFPEPEPAPGRKRNLRGGGSRCHCGGSGGTCPAEEVPVEKKQAERKKEAKKVVEEEEEDGEHAKDGVSLDDLFQMKPEMFQSTTPARRMNPPTRKKARRARRKALRWSSMKTSAKLWAARSTNAAR
jgi:transcription termination/antitermination protein NusA